MIEIGRRRRTLPPPPRIVFESLVDPHRDRSRPWLVLLDDEHEPAILAAEPNHTVRWSSLWDRRPDAVLEFSLSGTSDGTSLEWTLWVDEPMPDSTLLGHLRKRVNVLINANLRYSYGQ